ncbi:MAG: hypothetical protein ABI700_01455 [Chloroflexota bacterium]
MVTWSSNPPEGCPFEPSERIQSVTFTGRNAVYTRVDTWYPSWAENDILYSPFTDGLFNPEAGDQAVKVSSDCRNAWNQTRADGFSGTGQARILGDDPLNLTVENLGIRYAPCAPYGGRYPCGSLLHNGIWYYGTYSLDETDKGLNWDVLGPFVGFRTSSDYGVTWTETPHTPGAPLFGESGKNGGKIKIGAPHFVDFGKNMQHSPDGKAYLVGHGAVRPDSNLAWIAGDQVYLTRVTPSLQTINDADAYEFFAGYDQAGAPKWARNFDEIQPLIEWNGRVGHVTVTYNPALKRYLMCITDGWPTITTMNTYLLESEQLTGPWKQVVFMEKFGEQAYFVNIPSKFISADGKTIWLCYSANFTNLAFGTSIRSNPPGSSYALCLQEVYLDGID